MNLKKEFQFIITSRNLIIRKLEVKDISKKYIGGLNDKKIMQFTESKYKKWNYKNVSDFIRKQNTNNIIFAIYLKEPNKHIGNIRLFNINRNHNTAELSLLFFDTSEWSKGYATEAVIKISNFAFNKLRLNRIYADYYENNLASRKLFKKTGYNIEGIFKKHFKYNGKYISSIRVARLYKK